MQSYLVVHHCMRRARSVPASSGQDTGWLMRLAGNSTAWRATGQRGGLFAGEPGLHFQSSGSFRCRPDVVWCHVQTVHSNVRYVHARRRVQPGAAYL